MSSETTTPSEPTFRAERTEEHVVVHAARPLSEAQAGDITFVEDEKHAHLLHASRASAVVERRSNRPAIASSGTSG